MIAAGALLASLTSTADVETDNTPITTAMYGLNGGTLILLPPKELIL